MPGEARMLLGGALFVVGLLITVLSASSAGGGGRYVIMAGLMVVGAIQFFWGLMSYLDKPAPPASAAPSTMAVLPAAVRTLLDVVCRFVRRGDAPTKAELDAIAQTIVKVADATVPPDRIDALVRSTHAGPTPRAAAIAAAARSLEQTGKEETLRGALCVMIADGPRADTLAETAALAAALGLPPEIRDAIIKERIAAFDGRPQELQVHFSQDEARAGGTTQFSFETLIVCDDCGGAGCGQCDGRGRRPGKKQMTLNYVSNLKDWTRLEALGEGEAPFPGGRPGDLVIYLRVDDA